jgi:hypothetical protein
VAEEMIGLDYGHYTVADSTQCGLKHARACHQKRKSAKTILTSLSCGLLALRARVMTLGPLEL